MGKLLSAETNRLFHSLIFKLGMLYSGGMGILVVMMRWLDVRKNAAFYASLSASASNVDGLVFVGGLYNIFAIAVFVGIFVGTEASDGTIRNKLMVGCRRWEIYLGEWLVCSLASLLFHLAYIVVALGVGVPLLGTTWDIPSLLLLTLAGSAATIALTSILVLAAMAIQNKAVGSVVCLLLVILSLFLTLFIFQKLLEPEYTRARTIEDEETGAVIEIPSEPNPYYLSGTVRQIYLLLQDALPLSQLYQVVVDETEKIPQFLLWDGAWIILTLGVGMPIFKRKNLK